MSGDEDGPGFAPAQVRYTNGMKVEVLRPNLPERIRAGMKRVYVDNVVVNIPDRAMTSAD